MGCKVSTANLSTTDAKAIRIVTYFVDKGLTPTQGCAIAGNVFQESGYDEYNDPGTSYGLFQYERTYNPDFDFNSKPGFDYQLDYTWKKYSTEKHYGNSTKGTDMWRKWHNTELKEYFTQDKGNIDDYTDLWGFAFERPRHSMANYPNRRKEARRVGELYNSLIGSGCTNADLSASVIDRNSDASNDNNETVYAVNEKLNCVDLSGASTNVSESTTTGGSGAISSGVSFSGRVTNEKMKLVLADVSYFINFGAQTAKCPYPTGSKVPEKLGNYMRKCTSGPTTWYKNAGIQLRWWNSPYKATVEEMKRNLSAAGMVPVWHGTGQEANVKFSRANGPKYLRPGDVASMLSSNSAHGAMWTGDEWRSDCIQRDGPYPYGNTNIGRGGDWTFILWRHPDLQEPGLDTSPIS